MLDVDPAYRVAEWGCGEHRHLAGGWFTELYMWICLKMIGRGRASWTGIWKEPRLRVEPPRARRLPQVCVIRAPVYRPDPGRPERAGHLGGLRCSVKDTEPCRAGRLGGLHWHEGIFGPYGAEREVGLPAEW